MPRSLPLSIALASLLLDTVDPSAMAAAAEQPPPSTTWPMSGGRDGSWTVETDNEVPCQWSVRNDENIKWRKALPAGGQSGIAVWGDRLFLTINPPLDTPPFRELESRLAATHSEYDQRLAAAAEALRQAGDALYRDAMAELKKATTAWEDLLSENSAYQRGAGRAKQRIERALQNNDPIGQAYAAAQAELQKILVSQDPQLVDLQKESAKLEKSMTYGPSSADMVLLCLSAESGDTIWQRTIKGELSSDYNYGFSDSTTPCPITDGQHVWALSASGGMACFTMEGEPVWERTWMPTTGGPFNKQFDSILYQDSILSVEPPAKGDASRVPEWNYLHAFDKYTGELQWTSADAVTHYNTPVLGTTADGLPAVLMGRGGPHKVPERPVGLSLVSLAGETAGKSLWRWEPEQPNQVSGWGALNTQHWNAQTTSWFTSDSIITIDALSAKTISKRPMNVVDQHVFDENAGIYLRQESVKLAKTEWEWYTNFPVGDKIYYVARHAPFLACYDTQSGKTERIELPREFANDGSYIWATPQSNDGLNARGQRHGSDPRTLGDGFQRCFLGTPTLINNYLFFTNAVGMVYVIDVNADTFDHRALVAVNDLGVRGETWTVNSLSYASGHIYHRTLKEVICIGE